MARGPNIYRGPRGEPLVSLEDYRRLIGHLDRLEAELGERDRRRAEQDRGAADALRTMEVMAENDRLRKALHALEDDARAGRAMPAAAEESAPPLDEKEPASEREAALVQRVTSLQADLANVRRHADTQVARAVQQERAARLSGLAGIGDALRRALASAPSKTGPWFEGIEAVERSCEAELRRAGAVRFADPGDPYDPTLHEAVGAVPVEPSRVDRLIEVYEPGYRFEDGGLVRAAKVLVGRDRPQG